MNRGKENWLAQIDWAGGNMFLGTDTAGHTVVYDSADEFQRGIGPMRALLTSLGSCAGIDIVAILNKRKQKLKSLKILVTGDRPPHGLPKPWTSIHMKYVLSGENLEKKYVEEAIKDSSEKYCSVGATLKPTATITYSYEIVD